MVEFILISIAVVAVIMFALNMRSVRGADGELKMLDGNPHWESGVVTAVERTGEYIGLPTAKLTLTFGVRDHELSGPLPLDFADQIVPGLPIEGHVEYDMLDTLRTSLWDPSPSTVLDECAQLLEAGSEPSDDEPRVLTLKRHGRKVEICVAEDGWLLVIYYPKGTRPLEVDLRTNFENFENAHMLTERLGVLPDQAEHAPVLQQLSPTTLEALEQFAVCIDGWISIDGEAVELECSLPFTHPELVVTIVGELVRVSHAIEQDLQDRPEGDGAW